MLVGHRESRSAPPPREQKHVERRALLGTCCVRERLRCWDGALRTRLQLENASVARGRGGGGGGGGAGCVPGPASRLVPERNAPTACGRGSANRLRTSSLCSHRKCGFWWYAAGTCDAVEKDAQMGTRVSRAEIARAHVQPDLGALHIEGLRRDGEVCTRTLQPSSTALDSVFAFFLDPFSLSAEVLSFVFGSIAGSPRTVAIRTKSEYYFIFVLAFCLM
ncbi:hypothetical protein DFH11DRAFT_1569988 [Phellopilus nigrolimitatus]|nr:hypothetical protein DFH11DRAFT_1569988 [Phellopilus nigrolimitatus]